MNPEVPQHYKATLLYTQEGEIFDAGVAIPKKEIDFDDFKKALFEIGRTARVITDPQTGRPFEIATANLDAPEEDYDGEISTFSSNLTDGNATEFAENAACNLNRKRVYIANFGNGGTAYFSKEERGQIRKTGSYLMGDVENPVAIPSIQALDRALKHNGIHISRFNGVSAGNNVVTALMAEMPAGQVTDVYMKGPLNAVDFLWLRLAYEMGITENVLNGRANKRNSQDEWQPDKLKSDLVIAALYGLRKSNRLAAPSGVFKHNVAAKFLTDVAGFSKGPASGSPLVYGLVAALNAQTEARITMHCGEQDVLYDGRTQEVISTVLEQAARLGGIALTEDRLQALVMDGSHADHTYEPTKRMSTEAAVFSRSITRPTWAYRVKERQQPRWYRQS